MLGRSCPTSYVWVARCSCQRHRSRCFALACHVLEQGRSLASACRHPRAPAVPFQGCEVFLWRGCKYRVAAGLEACPCRFL